MAVATKIAEAHVIILMDKHQALRAARNEAWDCVMAECGDRTAKIEEAERLDALEDKARIAVLRTADSLG